MITGGQSHEWVNRSGLEKRSSGDGLAVRRRNNGGSFVPSLEKAMSIAIRCVWFFWADFVTGL
jgi:hypothetical protein